MQLNGMGETRLRVDLDTNTLFFLENVMSRLKQQDSMTNQMQVWDTAYTDLIRLAQIDLKLAHRVELLATQIRCHLLMAKVMNNPAWLDASSFNTQEGGVVKSSIDQLLKLSLKYQTK